MFKVAILGFGTVGSGVAEVLQKNAALIEKRVGEPVELKYIVDIRDFSQTPYASLVTADFAKVESDPEITLVVETIGGCRAALDFTRRALTAGKHVVTSNKELVATHGTELLAIAREKRVNYLFEASVGGGIPILRPMLQCLTANQITEITGILNGTTNYILSKMFEENGSYEEALKEAQAMGYAEANPTADVDGIDACRKTAILADLAYGIAVDPAAIETEGIRGVTPEDAVNAAKADCVIKLLGRSILRKDGRIWAYVAPHLVPRTEMLSHVRNVFNAIRVTGDAVGDVLFYGQGAGKMPTASAVVADVVDALKHNTTRRNLSWDPDERPASAEPYVADLSDMPCAFYVRGDAAGLFADAKVLSDDAFITPVMPTGAFREAIQRHRDRGHEILSVFRVL